MMDWILQYWIEALFGLIMLGLGFAYRNLAKRAKDARAGQLAIKRGVQALLRDRIIQAYQHFAERGSWPIHSLESMEELYAEYTTLGGNGTITALMEELRDLPRKLEE